MANFDQKLPPLTVIRALRAAAVLRSDGKHSAATQLRQSESDVALTSPTGYFHKQTSLKDKHTFFFFFFFFFFFSFMYSGDILLIHDGESVRNDVFLEPCLTFLLFN